MQLIRWFGLSFVVFFVSCGAINNQTISPQNTARLTQNANSRESVKPAAAVQVSAAAVEIKAGTTAAAGEAVIKLSIQPPFHINANPPSEDNLIPTAVEFSAQNGLTFEKPIYPAGEMKKFAFSEKPLSVYDGDVEIKLPFKISRNAATGEQTLNGKLRFQPCDDEVCYRPQTVDVQLIVRII